MSVPGEGSRQRTQGAFSISFILKLVMLRFQLVKGCGHRMLCEIFTTLFGLATFKETSVRDCFSLSHDGMKGCPIYKLSLTTSQSTRPLIITNVKRTSQCMRFFHPLQESRDQGGLYFYSSFPYFFGEQTSFTRVKRLFLRLKWRNNVILTVSKPQAYP